MNFIQRLKRLASLVGEALRYLSIVRDDFTPEERLMRAICQGKLRRVEFYLDFVEVDVNTAITLQPYWVLEPCSYGGFYTPVTPLAVAVSLTSPESDAVRLLRMLTRRGALASLHEYWQENKGRHTCLSKALQRGYYELAGELLRCGANPDLLVSTDLLSSTKFRGEGVSWLINRSMVTPGAVPAWVDNQELIPHVVQETMLQALRIRRQTASFLPSHRRNRIAALTRKALRIVVQLSAAGAPPAGAPAVPPEFEEPGWRELSAAASTRLAWCTESHEFFPQAFKEAVRQLLLVSHTGGFASAATATATGDGEGRRSGGWDREGMTEAGPSMSKGSVSRDRAPHGYQGSPRAEDEEYDRQSRSSRRSSTSRAAVAGSVGDALWFDENIMFCIFRQLARVH